MAGNYLTLNTNDRVVVTTSRGNQENGLMHFFESGPAPEQHCADPG